MDPNGTREQEQQPKDPRGLTRRGLLAGAAAAGALAAPLLRAKSASAGGIDLLGFTGALRKETGTVQGWYSPGFKRVRDVFEELRERGEVGAAPVCVMVDGKPVVDLWGGTANPATNTPWQRTRSCTSARPPRA